ncbi:MAG: hypothetical protein IJ248_03550 [Candidatus Methanomethylophilaceae archaeon]|nr:hypothetical protein [Candidatus Methanomethylophilaceae archaeon]
MEELCSRYAEDDEDLQDKIRCFLEDRSIDAVTGIRRMGRENLVRFVSEMGSPDCSIFPDTSGSIVIFYHWLDMDQPAQEILKEDPDKDILYGQDLCHQVPAVVRYNVKKRE